MLAVLSAEVVLRADDGEAGAVRAMGGQIRAAFVFTIEPDRIAGTDIIMDPSHLAAPDVTIGCVVPRPLSGLAGWPNSAAPCIVPDRDGARTQESADQSLS